MIVAIFMSSSSEMIWLTVLFCISENGNGSVKESLLYVLGYELDAFCL